MGPRVWAALGNLYKLSAVAGFLLSLLIAERAYRHAVPSDFATSSWVAAGLMLGVSILLWNVKGPLVRGNLILRVIFGLYTLGWIVSTVGIGLIVILVIYLFTGEPSAYDLVGKHNKPKPRFKAPANWVPTAKVGPSGAMVYSDSARGAASGLFDSFTPVQVTDKRGGVAHVVASTGEGGWIDLRTLVEA